MHRTALSSLILAAMFLLAPSTAPAMSMRYAIDLDVIDSISPALEPGYYRRIGGFRIDDSLLSPVATFIPWAELSDFTLTLPNHTLGTASADSGSCLTAAQVPFCGIWFLGDRLQGIVGQFSMAADPLNLFRFDNTSPSLFDPGALYQGMSLEDLSLGYTVASGQVSIRPVPEPASIALFLLGALLISVAVRRRLPHAP